MGWWGTTIGGHPRTRVELSLSSCSPNSLSRMAQISDSFCPRHLSSSLKARPPILFYFSLPLSGGSRDSSFVFLFMGCLRLHRQGENKAAAIMGKNEDEFTLAPCLPKWSDWLETRKVGVPQAVEEPLFQKRTSYIAI